MWSTILGTENNALLAAFGINLDDLPTNLQAELDEIVDAKRTYALTDFNLSTLSDFYLTQSEAMLAKRAALAELELRYSDCLDEEESIQHQINDANKWAELYRLGSFKFSLSNIAMKCKCSNFQIHCNCSKWIGESRLWNWWSIGRP